MNKKAEDAKASLVYIICSVFQKGLSLLTLPLFTRLLTTAEYGISTVYSSTMACVIIFATLNLPYGSFSTAMMKFEKDRDGYISAVNAICAIFVGLYFVLYFSFSSFWNDLADLPSELMILMGFEMLFSSSILFWMGKARFELKYKSFAVVTITMSVISTACSILAVLVFSEKGTVKVIANGLVVCVVGFVIMVMSVFQGKKCFNKEYWKYALGFNIPLIPYYLSQIIFNQSDRLMINKMVGKSEAAMYGVAYTLAFVLLFLLNAVNNSFVPWMYRMIKENKLQDNKSVSITISVVLAVLLLGIIALAPEIIMVMAGDQYMPAIWAIPPVAISLLLLFYSQLFINIEFYYEEKYKLVGASILAAVVNVVLNYIGIERFGFVAAGYTTMISYILFAVCNYYAMKTVCKKKKIEGELFDIKNLISLFLVFVLIALVFTALYPYRIVRLSLVVLLTLVVLISHKRLVRYINGVVRILKE